MNNDAHVRAWKGPAYEHVGILDKAWLGRTWVAGELGAGVVETAQAGVNFANNAWEGNPDTFKEAGIEAGGILGTGLGAVGGFVMSYGAYRRRGLQTALKYKGATFGRTNAGLYERVGGGRALSAARAETLLKGGKATRGFINGKSFLKPQSMIRDLALYIIGPMVVGAMAGKAMGFAGKFIDEAVMDQRSRKANYYDNRYIDTTRYDNALYNQTGAAMQDYSSRMMSVARIYHAR